MAMIEVKNITKSFNVKKYDEASQKYVADTLTVLRDFSVDFSQEGVTVLLGPSGTGKSTHSRLWREYFGDRVTMINDDKPFIRIGETESRVYGSPWDGKHHLSTNMSVPIKAICILERDTVNHIEPISADDAFAILYQQTYRSKDPAKLVKTIDLLTRMSSQVKLYRLGCNMEPDAARVSYEGMNHE